MKQAVQVKFSRLAEKQLYKLPLHIQEDVRAWIIAVTEYGMRVIRKKSGYHDEPLKGNRYGQRSIRLNRSYRLIYAETTEGQILLIVIIEVNKHDY